MVESTGSNQFWRNIFKWKVDFTLLLFLIIGRPGMDSNIIGKLWSYIVCLRVEVFQWISWQRVDQ